MVGDRRECSCNDDDNKDDDDNDDSDAKYAHAWPHSRTPNNNTKKIKL